MSSAMRSGSCSGTSSALIVAMIVFVRPNTSPAITSGDGLHPFVGAVVLLQRDRLETVLVGVTRHLHERLVALPPSRSGSRPGWMQLKRTTEYGMAATLAFSP